MNEQNMQQRREPVVNTQQGSPVRFSKLYRRALASWPQTVSVADGHPIGQNRYSFPTLDGIYKEIRHESTDEWISMMSQCIYEVSHAFSKYLAMSGVEELRLHNVPVEDIAMHVEDHLAEEWDADQAARFVNDSETMEPIVDAEQEAA